MALATCGAYVYGSARLAFAFSLRLDGGECSGCALFRRQRIDVGAYEDTLFPRAYIHAFPSAVFSERLRLVLVDKVARNGVRARANSPAFLYV